MRVMQAVERHSLQPVHSAMQHVLHCTHAMGQQTEFIDSQYVDMTAISFTDMQ